LYKIQPKGKNALKMENGGKKFVKNNKTKKWCKMKGSQSISAPMAFPRII
jgi:phage pi2 protein 07